MEVRPEIGVYLEILGLTRCPTEEEYGQARHSSMERDKSLHHRWVYLSKTGHIIKNGCKGSHGENLLTTRS